VKSASNFEAVACDLVSSFQTTAPLIFMELECSSNNSVEDIRNLRGSSRYAPQKGDYKVYIIDEVAHVSTSIQCIFKDSEEAA